MIYFNYALLLQFAFLAIGWFLAGDRNQAVYWLGAFILNAAVTFK